LGKVEEEVIMEDTKTPLVSIIIPVYNTEKFVRRAIESVLAQTYTNIELILVNDGSLDSSGEICDEYANRNPRIKVIHQINSGVSVARNAGLDISSGEYIQFVDSDDEINRKMTETLVNTMKEQDSDVVICGYSYTGQTKKDITSETRLYTGNEFLFLSYIDAKISPLILSSCNMIFKNYLLREYRLRFNSSYAMGEDGLFTLEYIMNSKKVFVLNQIFYNYYIFNPEERISAISYFSPDVYELRIRYFERLFSGLKCDVGEQEKIVLMRAFYSKLIVGLVRLGAYFEYFSNNDIDQRLKNIVNNEYVIQASKVYKRERKGDSVLIPLFMRWKSVKLLYLALRKRGKQYISKYGKRSIVRSIYMK
jgi:glycosyltransferase involved in cell wall biosynthesis